MSERRAGYAKEVTDRPARDDAERDAYPPDAQFGRAAAEDAERAEKGEARRRGEDVRAAGKAEPAGNDDDVVDEQTAESFPASDPPSNR